jgi:hypothetical protein
MVRSDGTVINLDRICGSNILLEKPAVGVDPGAVRSSELEWGPGGPR